MVILMEPPAHDREVMVPDSWDEPDASTPWTLGLLNVIFGALLILGGICSGLNFALQWAMGPVMAQQQQQLQQVMEAQRQAEMSKLDERERASQDENEKARLRAQRQAVQSQPMPKIPDTSKFMRDSRVLSYLIGDILTGMGLNVMMLIAGVGLMRLRRWGRETALWVAGLKLVRLVILYGYFAVAVVPAVVRQLSAMFEEMAKSLPPGSGALAPDQFGAAAAMIGVMMVVFSVGMILLGAIYPIIVLILLTRQRVKAAFMHAR
jgi:hypothetical protein